jgi:hypothetical protein
VHGPVGSTLEESARLVLQKTFALTGGDHAGTARLLGIEERELRDRLLSWLDEPVAAHD